MHYHHHHHHLHYISYFPQLASSYPGFIHHFFRDTASCGLGHA